MTGFPIQPPDFGAYPKLLSLSLFERQAEAERLEEGCRLELQLFDDKIAEALKKMREEGA